MECRRGSHLLEPRSSLAYLLFLYDIRIHGILPDRGENLWSSQAPAKSFLRSVRSPSGNGQLSFMGVSSFHWSGDPGRIVREFVYWPQYEVKQMEERQVWKQ